MQVRPVQEAIAIAFAPPSLPGLGLAGGFSLQLQDRGGVGLRTLEAVANEVAMDGEAQTGLTGMFSDSAPTCRSSSSTSTANRPRRWACPCRTSSTRSRPTSARAYVNDFNLFGRIYQVKAQADSAYRARPEDIPRSRYATRTAT